jgi:L-lactate dehydrogenase complex protein LldG
LEGQEAEMTEKEKILTRVREALTVRAHFPGAHGDVTTSDSAVGQPRPASVGAVGRGVPTAPHPSTARPNAHPSSQARSWLPLVGESFEARLALFQKNSADLKTTVHLIDGQDQLAGLLRNLREAEGWKKVATHSGELTDEAVRVLDRPVCRTDRPYNVSELENCDVGITECDALIAQTGSVLVTSRSAGGRALSVLPPHHVVLARRDQLIADLPAAFDLLKKKYGTGFPSFISFITGPSRTGDIERILVLGAHGPRRLTIFLL